MHRILIRHRKRTWTQGLAPGEELRLGAGTDNDVVLPVPGISRRHATVQLRGGGVLLSDLGSKNGLILDGRRQPAVWLEPRQVVQVGEAFLTWEEISTADASLALRLDPGSSHMASSRAASAQLASSILSGSRATGSWDRHPSKEAAREVLAFARAFGRETPAGLTQRLPEVLDRAKAVLGARALFVLEWPGGTEADGRPENDFVVAAHSGPLPSSERLDELMRRRDEDADPEAGRRLILQALPEGAALGVHLKRAMPLPLWQRDFLAYLTDLLAGRRPLATAGGPAAATDAEQAPLPFPPEMVVGSSAATRELLGRLRHGAASGLDVLLTGETGVGKELYARLVHAAGPQGRGPFVSVNCAAIPEELLEAELFGVAPGAASGVRARKGRFVQAQDGSILLDEIGEMPETVQAKLLRVLQEREVWPVGASRPQTLDVRVISATNRDLEERIRRGRFRKDLYYRLCVLCFHIPPLRQRREEIAELTQAFVRREAKRQGKRILGISRRALATLEAAPWPGNVRQLRSEIARGVVSCPSGTALHGEHLSVALQRPAAPESAAGRQRESGHDADEPAPDARSARPQEEIRPLRETLDGIARREIVRALERTGGQKKGAAQLLSLSRRGLDKMIQRLQLRLGKPPRE